MEQEKLTTRTVAVLVRDRKKLQFTDGYLAARGWNLEMHTSIRSLVERVTQKTPFLILLSVEFPKNQLNLLRDSLRKITSSKLVFFSETDHLIGFCLLRERVHDAQIQGPPSGPHWERTFRRFLRDQENAETADTGLQRFLRTPPESKNQGFLKVIESSFLKPSKSNKAFLQSTQVRTVQGLQVFYEEGSKTFLMEFDVANTEAQTAYRQAAEETILAVFQEQGHSVKESIHFTFPCSTDVFADWAKKEADLLFEFELEEKVGLMAVLASEKASFEDLELPLHLIGPQDVFDFDLYVYFEGTQREALVVPRTQKLNEKLRTALERNGIQKLKVKAQDRIHFQRYQLSWRYQHRVALSQPRSNTLKATA